MNHSQPFQCLTVSTDGPVATLELQRPQDGNAFDTQLHAEFPAALAQLQQAADIRVILLCAAGPHFSVGGGWDFVRRLSEDADLRRKTQRDVLAIYRNLDSLPVPIVAAVHGHALGVGATIVSRCDVSVAWREAKIGDPHVRVGLVAGDGGVLGWAAAVGFNRARRLLLTGDLITAAEAHQIGLITDLVDTPEAARIEARKIAERIAALPPVAVQGTRRSFNELAKAQSGTVLEYSLQAEIDCLLTEDLREALKAAAEKRPGVFKNR